MVTSPLFKVMTMVFSGSAAKAETDAVARPASTTRNEASFFSCIRDLRRSLLGCMSLPQKPASTLGRHALFREFGGERTGNGGRYEGTDVSAHRGYLAHKCGGNGAYRWAGGQKNRLQFRRHGLVHAGHLHLV